MKVYLDNAATSWPKPPGVVRAISDHLLYSGASPGRSGHVMSLKAAREVFETRELIARFFNLPASERVIFTNNGTAALNQAFHGLLNPGDHVIISHLEHNSVYRPLKYLESRGAIEITVVGGNEEADFDFNQFQNSFRPNTRLVATLHGSNVSGAVLPINQIGEICRSKGVLYLVDAAQTAGLISIDVDRDSIDILAFSGHKNLLGPTGIGCLCLKEDLPLKKIFRGGTGSRSEMAEHPDFYPDRLEAGTLNTLGIAGLKAGLETILKLGVDNICRQQIQMTDYLVGQLSKIEEVTQIEVANQQLRLPLVSIIIKGVPPSETALQLDTDFKIMTRAGLHCAPLAHKAFGTFPEGAVRLSPGIFTTRKEIDFTVEAIRKLCTS